ncbi:MAG TPA: DUF6677 family protein [Steroidobacteraceae bacterium]|jgi:hypothetical protein|nr:DUF6677 family protein [Steroidobacteraceae bacterium]
MATTPPAKTVPSSRNLAQATAAKSPLFSAALLAGWLIPGAGHLVAKRYGRAAVLFVAIGLMFVLGLLMQGKLYAANPADPLTMLGFVGDLGNGLLYIGGRLFGAGQTPVQVVTADYGTKFIVVAGLLNVIAAVDAHNLRIGRKQ